MEKMLRSVECFYLICALLCSYHYTGYAQGDGVDMTREPEVRGSLAVETVVDRIERSAIFENDFGYIRRIAWVETRDGLNRSFTFRPGYHGGLWQVDEVVFMETQNTPVYPQLVDKHEQILAEFDIEWAAVEWEDLRKPLHCGLAAWLYMFTRYEAIPLNIHDQADHWKRNYNRLYAELTVDEFVIRVNQLEAMNTDCHRDIDLYIILDTSGSISSEEYEIAKNFMADLVSGFNIGENNVRVGLVLFGSAVYPIFDLDDSFDKAVISNWIRGAPDYGGSTATGDGILFAANTGFTEASGARPSNLAIPHIAIVLTDGHSTQGEEYLVNASTVARDLSIELFALGIDDGIDENELLVIAGSQDRVYRIDTFTNIDDARALITQGSCKASVQADINTTYSGDLDNSESRSFEYEVPEEGITVQVEVMMGSVTLYGSYSNPNPSPIWYDFLVQNIQQSKDVFIPYPTASSSRRRRQTGQVFIFYCTLIGAAPQDNMFTISATNGTCNCGCGG